MATSPNRLTKVQREVLELLRDGAMMTVDSTNSTWIGEREVQLSTRSSLTKARLVKRRDPTKPFSKSNGFVISEKGLAALDGD